MPRAGASRGGDEDAGGFARARFGADDDFDVAVESGEEIHQTFDGEAFEAVIGKRGNFRLIDFEAARGCGLRDVLPCEYAVDGDSETYLRALFLRTGNTKIGKDVA